MVVLSHVTLASYTQTHTHTIWLLFAWQVCPYIFFFPEHLLQFYVPKVTLHCALLLLPFALLSFPEAAVMICFQGLLWRSGAFPAG